MNAAPDLLPNQPQLVALDNLVGLDRGELSAALASAGIVERELRMRTTQLWHWIYHRGATDFTDMTNVSKHVRATLAERVCKNDYSAAGAEASLRESLQRLGKPSVFGLRVHDPNDNNLNKAYTQLTSVNGASLMEINQAIWELIKGGRFTVKQVIDGIEDYHSVHFIDYINPENNDFLVVNQMKYHGRYQNSIPDLVVYINGLPIGVIECKSPSAQNAWDKAYNDLKYYQ